MPLETFKSFRTAATAGLGALALTLGAYALPGVQPLAAQGPSAGGPSAGHQSAGGESAGAQAGQQQVAALAQDDRELLQRVERYLNDIDTVTARFTQTSSNGAVAEGDLYLARPGRLRFEYDPPHPALLVANYGQLLYVDRELRETTYLPLSETPIAFLVRENVRLQGQDGVEVAEVEQRPGVVEVTMVQDGSEAGGPGSLTMTFSDQPLELRKWSLVDQQSVRTEVAIHDARFGQSIDGDLFEFGELDIPRVGPGPRPDQGR